MEYFKGNVQAVAEDGYFGNFISDSWQVELWFLVFAALVFIIILGGVQNGVERMSKIMMPVLVVLAVVVTIYSVTRPGAVEGVKYFLIPNVKNFSWMTVVAAMGQMFYSLSIAMGILYTYGSYVRKDMDIERSTTQVEVFDTGIAILAGLMIIPAAFAAMGSGEAVAENSGPTLMFVVLPQVFGGLGDMAPIIGGVFFILVLFAALTSSISLVETCTAIIQDATHCKRSTALIVTIVWTTLMGVIVNLGFGTLSFIQPLGEGSTMLDFFDFISNSVMMPVVALLTCIFIGWIVGTKSLEEEVMLSAEFKLRKVWAFMIKFIAPIVLVIILVAYVAQTMGLFTM